MLKAIRWIVGWLILLLDSLFPAKAAPISTQERANLAQKTASLSLYQFEACPFCVKVRRAMTRMNIRIELRDAKSNPVFAEELVQAGGKLQVPCLRIAEPNGSVRWLYESSDIIDFLRRLC